MTKMAEVSAKDPVARAFMLFMQASQAAYKYADHRLYDAGITTATFIALKGLVNSGGVMTHSQLAAWTNTEKHNITTLVDRMKKDGLVTNEYSQEDRRVAHVTITRKGRKALSRATTAAREIAERIMSGIGPKEAAQIEVVLKTMKANFSSDS